MYFKQYAQLAVKQSKKSLPIVKHISTLHIYSLALAK